MAEYAIDALMDDTAQAQYGFIAAPDAPPSRISA